MSDELPTLTLAGRRYVVVPEALAAKHGIGSDPAVARQRAIGSRLRAAREAAGLSQTELAERMGCGQPNVSAAECGRDPVGEERVATWLEACGLAPDWQPARRRAGKRAR